MDVWEYFLGGLEFLHSTEKWPNKRTKVEVWQNCSVKIVHKHIYHVLGDFLKHLENIFMQKS